MVVRVTGMVVKPTVSLSSCLCVIGSILLQQKREGPLLFLFSF